MIEVKNLTKKYGSFCAVSDLSFTIEKGKIYGFLGPNGAGKSTTMNIVTGCLSATDGQVLVDGADIFKDPLTAKKKIGYLPELPPLYTEMTPAEYLSFVAEAKGVGYEEAPRQVREVMELTQITHVADRLIRNLSKGYRQRVGIAQALLGNPEVILLDEPTVGLDPRQIMEIRELIRSLGQTKTVIVSSHILAEISAVCDHVMILSHGRLVANDSLAALEESALADAALSLTVKGAGEDVAALLSEIPFNLCFSSGSSIIKHGSLNVMVTLFLGLAGLIMLEWIKSRTGLLMPAVIPSLLMALFAELIGSDYGFYSVIMILLFYLIDPESKHATSYICAVSLLFGSRLILEFVLKSALSLLTPAITVLCSF